MASTAFLHCIEFVTTGTEPAVQGINSVSHALGAADVQTKKTAGSFKNLAGAFSALVVSKYIVGAMQAFIQPAKELELSMAKLRGLVGGSTKDLKEFQDAAFKAAAETAYGPKDAIDTLIRLRQATGDNAAAMNLLIPTLNIASASFDNLTPEKASIMMADLVKSFGLTGEGAAMAADEIYALSKQGGLQIQDLSGVIGKLGIAAKASGQDFRDTMIAFTMGMGSGLKPERLATELAALGREMRTLDTKHMRNLGFNPKDVVSGKMMGFGEMFGGMAKRFMDNPNSLETAVASAFGGAAVKPVTAIINRLTGEIKKNNDQALTGVQIWEKYRNVMLGAGGSLAEMAAQRQNTLTGAVERLGESLFALGATAGQAFLPVLSRLADGLGLVAKAVQWVTSLPGASHFLAFAGAALALQATLFALKGAWWGLASVLRVTVENLEKVKVLGIGAVQAITPGGAGAVSAAAAAKKAQADRVREVLEERQRNFAPLPPTFGGKRPMVSELLGGVSSFEALPGAGPQASSLIAAKEKSVGMLARVGSGIRAVGSAAASAGRAIMGALGGLPGLLATVMMFLPDIAGWLKKIGADSASLKANDWLIDNFGRGLGMKTAAEYQMAIQQKIAELKGQLAKREVEAAGEAYRYLQLGSKQFNEVLDRLQKLGKTDTPIVDVNAYVGLRDKLQQMQKSGAVDRYGEQETARLNRTMGHAARLEYFLRLSQKRQLSSSEYLSLSASATGFRLGAESLGALTNDPTLVALRKKFDKKALAGIMAWGKPDNVERSLEDAKLADDKTGFAKDPRFGLASQLGLIGTLQQSEAKNREAASPRAKVAKDPRLALNDIIMNMDKIGTILKNIEGNTQSRFLGTDETELVR